jgi:hypothetical protein
MVVHKFKISDRLFQGFEIDLDLDYYDSVEEICKQVKETLLVHLNSNNFEVLKDEAEKINFHIHDFDFGDILLKEEEDITWVCNH